MAELWSMMILIPWLIWNSNKQHHYQWPFQLRSRRIPFQVRCVMICSKNNTEMHWKHSKSSRKHLNGHSWAEANTRIAEVLSTCLNLRTWEKKQFSKRKDNKNIKKLNKILLCNPVETLGKNITWKATISNWIKKKNNTPRSSGSGAPVQNLAPKLQLMIDLYFGLTKRGCV